MANWYYTGRFSTYIITHYQAKIWPTTDMFSHIAGGISLIHRLNLHVKNHPVWVSQWGHKESRWEHMWGIPGCHGMIVQPLYGCWVRHMGWSWHLSTSWQDQNQWCAHHCNEGPYWSKKLAGLMLQWMKWEECMCSMCEICGISKLVEYPAIKLNKYTYHLVCQKQDCLQAEVAVAVIEEFFKRWTKSGKD